MRTTAEASPMESIVFVFGPARGGTTFVNNLLDDWFSVGTGPEGTFISEIVQFAERLGDLSDPRNCRRLAEAISRVQMFEIIRSRWPQDMRFDVTPDDILDRMAEPTLRSAIYGAFRAVADYRQKSRVGNKNPAYWRELSILHSLFPTNAKYLFVMRDGRDVALSLQQVPWGGQSVYEAACDWVRMVLAVRQFEARVPEDTVLTVRYEDLLQRPGATIDEMGRFLGIADRATIKTQYEQVAQRSEMKQNFDKWRNAMSPSDQIVFEAVAGDVLTHYGYERCYPNARIGQLSRMWYETERFVRRVRGTLYHSLSQLPIDSRKWKPTRFSSRIQDLIQPGTYRKKK